MKTVNIIAGLCLFSSLAFAGPDVWEIQKRNVPLPAGASEQLRQSIAARAQPNPEARRSTFNNIKDFNWATFIKDKEFNRGEAAVSLARSLGVSIDKHKIEGVTVYHVDPEIVNPKFAKSMFLFLHGGAYIFGGGDASVYEAIVIAHHTGMRILAVDYRMPPDHPFPAAIDDVVTVYRHLLGEGKESARLAIGGTSSGGGLALASVHKFRILDLPLPGAVYVGTPWADLSKTGDTQFTNEGLDRALVTYDGLLIAAAKLYADGLDLKHPLLSPVYGDFSGFPPTYLVTGTRDMFLSDTARTHRKLRVAGVEAELNVYEGMSHAGYITSLDTPESTQVYSELQAFLLQYLGE